jgi:hypothetical protein
MESQENKPQAEQTGGASKPDTAAPSHTTTIQESKTHLDAGALAKMHLAELTAIAHDAKVENVAGLRKQQLIARILEARAKDTGVILGEGVLEILPDGFGFLRSPEYNYLPGPDDIYVSPSQIKKFGLRKGDTVSGQVRPPKDQERFFALLQVRAVNTEPVEKLRTRQLFDNLTPLYAEKRIHLGNPDKKIIQIAAPWRHSREFATLHEVAHKVYEKLMTDKLRKKWSNLVKKTELHKDAAKEKNDEELFAHHYAQYYCNNKVVRYDHPELLDFIKNLP